MAVKNKKSKSNKSKKKRKSQSIKKKKNTKLLLIIAFFTAVLLIISSYAWFSVSLNVKVKFFDLVVSSDSGLFISLDGVNFSSEVEISIDSIIRDLGATYPNHTNQWSAGGLWPVSSNGIKNANQDKFDMYAGDVVRRRINRQIIKYLNTILLKEDKPNAANVFIGFDIFLKNVSGSPRTDNLYLTEETYIEIDENTPDDDKEAMSGIMDSMRFGILKIGHVPLKSTVKDIQNIKCNNNCEMVIYEPNSTSHSEVAIEKAGEIGIIINDGEYVPTYAVINEGERLEHTNGQEGSGFPLDTDHFTLQETIKEEDLEDPIFVIPNAITKLRVYVWIEGQDIDSLETNSRGAAIYIGISFEKDLAGYE
jgi:hypothetical protein